MNCMHFLLLFHTKIGVLMKLFLPCYYQLIKKSTIALYVLLNDCQIVVLHCLGSVTKHKHHAASFSNLISSDKHSRRMLYHTVTSDKCTSGISCQLWWYKWMEINIVRHWLRKYFSTLTLGFLKFKKKNTWEVVVLKRHSHGTVLS